MVADIGKKNVNKQNGIKIFIKNKIKRKKEKGNIKN